MDGLLFVFTAIAAAVGAIFAVWRWEYAVKAYALQKKQIYLQVLMLAESREYWRNPKEKYVEMYEMFPTTIDIEIKSILAELENTK